MAFKKRSQDRPPKHGGQFGWVAAESYGTEFGIGGVMASPTTAVPVRKAVLGKRQFTVVVVFCPTATFQASTELLRIGAGSTGVRLNVATSETAINAATWTLNAVVNGNGNIVLMNRFSTAPAVSILSVENSNMYETIGPLGGYQKDIAAGILHTSKAGAYIEPSDLSVMVKGSTLKVYAVAVLPWSSSLQEREGYVRNPWQLFAPRRIWVPQAAITGPPTLSLPTYTPGSLTATGFRPRVTAS